MFTRSEFDQELPSNGLPTNPRHCDKKTEHRRSSHYAITHVRNKDNNIQGRSPHLVKVIFHTIRNCSQRKEFASSESKYFPLREVPILKRDAPFHGKMIAKLKWTIDTIAVSIGLHYSI